MNAVLGRKLSEPLTAEEAALCMVGVKLARLAHTPDHVDSLIDVAGYARIVEMIGEERLRRLYAATEPAYSEPPCYIDRAPIES
jgi:hypothetical protein